MPEIATSSAGTRRWYCTRKDSLSSKVMLGPSAPPLGATISDQMQTRPSVEVLTT